MKNFLIFFCSTILLPLTALSMEEQATAASWKNLPVEIKLLIFDFEQAGLDPAQALRQIKALDLVSHEFQNLVRDERILGKCIAVYGKHVRLAAHNAMIRAEQCGDTDSCEHFRAYDITRDNLFNLLFQAIEHGHIDIVKSAIDTHGKKINQQRGCHSLTPLLWSCGHNQLKMALMFIAAGAFGKRGLLTKVWLTAAINGDANAIKELIEVAGLNDSDMNGYTALMYAAAAGHIDVVKLLIDNGAGIECWGLEGLKALHYATYFDRKEVVKFLISRSPRIDIPDYFGNTALMLALENNNKTMVELLISHGANVNKSNYDAGNPNKNDIFYPLSLAIRLGNQVMVALLIEKGALVNYPYAQTERYLGPRPIIVAARYGCKEIIQLLIDHGALLNATDQQDKTALMHAVEENQQEIVELLLANGANINQQDWSKKTALMLAGCNNQYDMIKLLVSYGAEISTRDRKNKTAFDYLDYEAARESDSVVLELLKVE